MKYPYRGYAASKFGSGYRRASSVEEAEKKACAWKQSDFGAPIVRRWVADNKGNVIKRLQ